MPCVQIMLDYIGAETVGADMGAYDSDTRKALVFKGSLPGLQTLDRRVNKCDRGRMALEATADSATHEVAVGIDGKKKLQVAQV